MGILRKGQRSEALRQDQGDDEVDAERQRHGEAKDDFKHGSLSDPGQGTRVKRQETEGQKANGEENDVGH
jgi:hypothetical protein